MPGAASLEAFRSTSRRVAIHPLELALLWVVGAHLAYLPWALGTMHVGAQTVSLIAATASLILALIPRNYTAEHTGGSAFRLLPLPKLLRFPIFWIGLALLGLVTLHGLNPAWEYQTDGKAWWMRKVAHTEWLPAGVAVPFKQWGPWRMLMIYAAAWMTVCAIWIGFTRRRTVQRLLLILVINAAAVALFGLAQRLLGATKIYWTIPSFNPSFFASFIYKNHAGAYLLLGLGVTSAVGAWYYMRGVRRLEKSNPSGVFAFLATCIAVSILISYARGATLTMMVFLTVMMAGFLYQQTRLPKAARNPLVAFALLLVFGFFLKTGLDALNSDLAWDRLRAAVSGSDLSVQARQTANQASTQMLQDHWVKGVGSGSYPFLFTIYQHRFPEIATRQFWNHAHNDWLELAIDFGLPGMLLMLAAFAYWGIQLVRNYAWQNPLSATLVLGCLSLMGMAWGEFVFFCPAVLITWCALWPIATRWAILEEKG